jgi:hypothetical protein
MFVLAPAIVPLEPANPFALVAAAAPLPFILEPAIAPIAALEAAADARLPPSALVLEPAKARLPAPVTEFAIGPPNLLPATPPLLAKRLPAAPAIIP